MSAIFSLAGKVTLQESILLNFDTISRVLAGRSYFLSYFSNNLENVDRISPIILGIR